MADEKLRLGGMALRNGLLIHGPTHWAAAVRDPGGSIEVASERKPELAPGLAAKLPGLRGPLKLAEALAVLPLVRLRMPAARLPFETLRVLGAIGATLVTTAAVRKRFGSSALREGAVPIVGAAPAIVGLAGASIAVELFAWSDRHHGDPLAEAFHTPGREIQRLIATKEPTPQQLEVGVAALAEILRAENGA
jgi:uncharacterized protein YqhQ